MPSKGLVDLSLADVLTFLSVLRHGALAGAARELGVTPSQVSKSIARVERRLRLKLLVRGPRGVWLTDAGRRSLPHLQEMANRLRLLGAGGQTYAEVTLGAPSYFNFFFLPRLARGLPELRLRGLDLPPTLLSAYTAANLFDLLISHGAPKLPSTWKATFVGKTRRALFANPRLARTLGVPPVSPERVLEHAFIHPLYFSYGQLLTLEDGCPVDLAERRLGNAVGTIALGLEMARQTEQLVFGPAVVAQPYVRRGELMEVQVAGWPEQIEQVYVAANIDRVRAKVNARVVEILKGALLEA